MGTVHLPRKPAARSKKTTVNPASDTGKALSQAVARIIEKETGAIIQHLIGKLPPGASDSLNIKSLKDTLSRSIERQYRELSARMAASAVQDEAAVGTRRTSAGVAQLLRSLGGSDTFKAAEAEKPAGKSGVGVFSPADNAVAIVKCRFRDNALKPKTVTDVKLAVNITEPELIGPAAYGCAAAQYLIQDLICRPIIASIDRGGDKGIIEEKRLAALLADIDNARFDVSNLRGNIAHSAGLEHIRTGGFNRAYNALVAILDQVQLDYQCIETTRNGREAAIHEYEDAGADNLPDERYALRLRYLDAEQLIEDRAAYDARIKRFEHDVQLLGDLIEVNYHDSKPLFKVSDFDDLAKKNKGRMRDLLNRTGGAPAPEVVVEPIAVRFTRMRERIQNMYEFLYRTERRIIEERLAALEQESVRLDWMINPHHLRPGLLIDADITSIKRRKTTLDLLAAALGALLHSIYGCFQDVD